MSNGLLTNSKELITKVLYLYVARDIITYKLNQRLTTQTVKGE